MDTATKSLLTSKTVWGVVISLGALLLQRFGIDLSDADQGAIVDQLLTGIQVVGGLYAIYGRKVADKKIG